MITSTFALELSGIYKNHLEGQVQGGRIVVKSSMRTSGTTGDFRIPLMTPMDNILGLAVDHVYINRPSPNVITGVNDTLDVTETVSGVAKAFSVVIPEGWYNMEALISYIISELKIKSYASGHGLNYSALFGTRITGPGLYLPNVPAGLTDLTFDMLSGPNAHRSCHKMIGQFKQDVEWQRFSNGWILPLYPQAPGSWNQPGMGAPDELFLNINWPGCLRSAKEPYAFHAALLQASSVDGINAPSYTMAPEERYIFWYDAADGFDPYQKQMSEICVRLTDLDGNVVNPLCEWTFVMRGYGKRI